VKRIRKWIVDCITCAIEDRRRDILCSRPPNEYDDFPRSSTWEHQGTGKKYMAIQRKTEWIPVEMESLFHKLNKEENG
jgi:hypothetical protein